MSKGKIIRVKEVMKADFDIVDGMSTVLEALQKMQHIDTKTLIVAKRHVDDEFGIVLLPDIARKVLAANRSPERVNVYEIMQKPVISVDPNMDVRYAARLFERFHLSRAPVIENDEILGIVSLTDMVLKGLPDFIHSEL